MFPTVCGKKKGPTGMATTLVEYTAGGPRIIDKPKLIKKKMTTKRTERTCPFQTHTRENEDASYQDQRQWPNLKATKAECCFWFLLFFKLKLKFT